MSIKLDGRAYAVLGRSGDADVRLEGKLCSRKHAVIGFDTSREHVYLVDLNSAHGTWVDTVRIEAETKWRLKVGQEIWFGSAEGEPRYVVNAVCSRKREREELEMAPWDVAVQRMRDNDATLTQLNLASATLV